MHAITISIVVNDGHQELLEQINQILNARGIEVCSSCETAISTSVIAQKLRNDAMAEPEENSAVAQPSMDANEPEEIETIQATAPESPKVCKIMQLSTEDEIPFIEDPGLSYTSLCVQNLSLTAIDRGSSVAFFTYCGKVFKVPVQVIVNLNTYTSDAVVEVTVSIADIMIRCPVILINSDTPSLLAGRNLIEKMSGA